MRRIGISAAFILAVILSGAGCASQPVATDSDAATDLPAPFIDQKANSILRQMSDFLGSQDRLAFTGNQLIDAVLEDGQKLQYGRSGRLTLKRPDQLRVEFQGDDIRRSVVYDGDTISMCDHKEGVYATTEGHETVDATLDYMSQELGVELPLADIIADSAFESLVTEATAGHYVGMHQVDGVECHHLAFTEPLVDWQIWIESGGRPVPRKLVITYKDTDSRPQFIGFLNDWEFTPPVTYDTFVFVPPDNAEEISFYRDFIAHVRSESTGIEQQQP